MNLLRSDISVQAKTVAWYAAEAARLSRKDATLTEALLTAEKVRHHANDLFGMLDRLASEVRDDATSERASLGGTIPGTGEVPFVDCDDCPKNYACTEEIEPGSNECFELRTGANLRKNTEAPEVLHADVQALLANRTISLMALGNTKNQKEVDRLLSLYPQVYETRNPENDGAWLTVDAQLGAYRVTNPTTYAMSQDRLNPAKHRPLSTSYGLSKADWRSRIRSCLRKLGEVGEEQALEKYPEIFTACAGETILTDAAVEGRTWFRRGGKSVAREE